MKRLPKIYVVNNLGVEINIACGADIECSLEPGESVELEVIDGDYIYLD